MNEKADQFWDGMVLEVLDETFIARLMIGGGLEVEAEILKSAITHDADLALIKSGARFSWSIVQLPEPVSTIRFQRFPRWTKKEIQAADQDAAEIKNKLHW